MRRSRAAGKRIALTGDEYPDAYEHVDPNRMRRYRSAYMRRMATYQQRIMNNEIPWCVAGVPVIPWAQKVFPPLMPRPRSNACGSWCCR